MEQTSVWTELPPLAYGFIFKIHVE